MGELRIAFCWYLESGKGRTAGLSGPIFPLAAAGSTVRMASVPQPGVRNMSPIAGALPVTLTQSAGGVVPITAKKADFTSALNQALEQVSLKQNEAEGLAQRFQLGDPGVSLEKTMVALQTSNISFQALVQVRNRVVTAYQDIMNMQV
jgi:flagellar hook-basal body complex protein FliE